MGGKIEPEKVRHRELVAWTRRKQGWTQGKIAEHLGISQAAVSKILRRVDRRTLKRMERDVKLVKVKQAGRLEELFEETMWAWHNSKSPTERTLRRRGTEGIDDVTELRSTSGDPRFLAEARAILEAELKLWGLDPASAKSSNLEAKPPAELDRERIRRALADPIARELVVRLAERLALPPGEGPENDSGYAVENQQFALPNSRQ